MPIEKIDTLVVGAGQAGVAMSEHLSANDIPHLVVERDRIAERWRTGRWDSLVANGPAWHDRFPHMEFPDIDPDAFVPKESVADYFVEYAKFIDAPIRTDVDLPARWWHCHSDAGFIKRPVAIYRLRQNIDNNWRSLLGIDGQRSDCWRLVSGSTVATSSENDGCEQTRQGLLGVSLQQQTEKRLR